MWSWKNHLVVWIFQSIATGIIAIVVSRNLHVFKLVGRLFQYIRRYYDHFFQLYSFMVLYDVSVSPANRTYNCLVLECPALSCMQHWAPLGHWCHCCSQWAGFDGRMQQHRFPHQRSVSCQCPLPVRHNAYLCESKLSLRCKMIVLLLSLSFYHLISSIIKVENWNWRNAIPVVLPNLIPSTFLCLRTPPWHCGSLVLCWQQLSLACQSGASSLVWLSEGWQPVGTATSKSRCVSVCYAWYECLSDWICVWLRCWFCTNMHPTYPHYILPFHVPHSVHFRRSYNLELTHLWLIYWVLILWFSLSWRRRPSSLPTVDAWLGSAWIPTSNWTKSRQGIIK